jgi:hypothetical protein
MENLEKRCYVFSHFMLSPMAKGIQTLHSTVELFNKYTPNMSNDNCVDDLQYDILFDWSINHKTVISLNAGVSGDLDDLMYVLQDPDNQYPWADFCEDEYSLKGVRTAASIVLTEKIYETAALFRTRNFEWDYNLGRVICLDVSKVDVDMLEKVENYGRFSAFEMNFISIINQYRLAN